jgi:UDP-galactose transporter B1
MIDKVGKEVRFVGYVLGLYCSFIYWGYLQEKLTSVNYLSSDGSILRWDYPVSLNLFMALAAYITAMLFEKLYPPGPEVSAMIFSRAAISLAIASPLGYASLKYINFPLMMLTKSSKPIPVMLMGVLFYGKKYPWFKYVSVGLLCGGIAIFSIMQSSKKGAQGSDWWKMLIGLGLVGCNLFLDGYTNNEQDLLFKKYKLTIFQMMKNVNLWQFIYMLVYLTAGLAFYRADSELYRSLFMFTSSPAVRFDIFIFGVCASVGQLLIFTVMKEFGSLLWITISITRKFITVVSSVILFKHEIAAVQWIGVLCVFGGMTLEVVMNYIGGANDKSKDSKKTA